MLGDRANLKSYSLRDRLVDAHVERRNLRGLEAFRLGAQNIPSWLDVDEDKVAVGIRGDPIGDLRRLIG